MKVFVLDFDHDGEKIFIYGRDENGKKVRIETYWKFYIYIILKDPSFEEEVIKRLKSLNVVKNIEVENKNFIGREYRTIKVYIKEKDYDIIKNFVDTLKQEGKVIGKKESDISIIKKFQIDNSIYPLNWYDFDLELINSSKNIDYYKLKKVNDVIKDKKYNLKVVAIDIESIGEKAIPDPEKDPIYLVSLYDGKNFYSIYWKGNSEIGIKVNNEYELLDKFNNIIREIDPDIIVGYNSNNFDFFFFYERAKKLGYIFNFGWDGKGLHYTKKGEDKKYRIVGIQHVDLFDIIVSLFSGQLDSETYSLEEVAREILGETKLDMDINLMNDIIHNNKDFMYLIKYNQKDVELTYKLYKHFEKIILELSKISGTTLYELSGATYGTLVENYLIKRAREFNEIIPNKPDPYELEKRKKVSYVGAFVLEPKAGFYKNIMVLDFRSLYPSIIIKYNISPDTLKCEHEECRKNSFNIETSLGKYEVWYCNKKEGFIVSILKSIFEERANLKKILKNINKNTEEYKEIDAKQYSLKILSNSMYGYLGFPNSRWYCLECAASITAMGRKHILEVIKKAEQEGLRPIYGDTDSIFLLVDNKEKGLEFLDKINKELPKPLELELEDFYVSGIFIEKRSGGGGAKKKYALLSESGSIKLRGFEVVRRDWSDIAKEAQETVIKLALQNKKNEIIEYLRKLFDDIKNRRIPIEKFVLREQLRKSLEEYEVSAPHVIAARKYKDRGFRVGRGFIVEYVICRGGSKISDKVRLTDEVKGNDYDVEYYIERQIIPAIEGVMKAIGLSVENIYKIQKDITSYFKNGGNKKL